MLYDGGSEDPEVYANASLIATAPKLLEACRDARDALLAFGLVVVQGDLDRDPRMVKAMEPLTGLGARLDAVIAAAEGGRP